MTIKIHGGNSYEDFSNGRRRFYRTPEITFVLDQSIEYGVNMSKKISDVTRDLDMDGEEDAE